MDTNHSGGGAPVCAECGTEMRTPKRITNPALSGAKEVVDDDPYCPNKDCSKNPGDPEPWRRG